MGHFCAFWVYFIHFWLDAARVNLPQPPPRSDPLRRLTSRDPDAWGIFVRYRYASRKFTSFGETSSFETFHNPAAGIGEAGVLTVGPPLINDVAPPAVKSAFVGSFFATIFVGAASTENGEQQAVLNSALPGCP